ncbi:hypothetical protein [Nonlabens ponticola]|uniref:Uncharacterized protein n=1 Tax=Nonlabens ponticola TaxID=2496866 RepID=A0A3S9MXJ4_9FLAO|nr:hypothetical protein [Nonlabens ponticola]AZQ43858.1 hypothetical protein EJ995_06305 [Nonlabens ponticola]
MFDQYADWIYIAAVIIAFFVFLGWNKSRQKSLGQRKRRNFKQSFRDKRADRQSDSGTDFIEKK